jgi:hypothetical protein
LRLAVKQDQAQVQGESSTADTGTISRGLAVPDGHREQPSLEVLDLAAAGTVDTNAVGSQFSFPGPTVDTHFLVLTDMTAYGALAAIAQVLDLNCLLRPGFHIQASVDKLPSPIAPTQLQNCVAHRPYVDMLPWPSLRDRLLRSITAINEDEFMTDMLNGSFKVWGSVPWDPMGWEVGEDFATRWWFLIDDGIIRTTNFWRAQRGEKPLRVSFLRQNIAECD